MFLSLRVCGIHFNHGVFEGFNHIQCVHAYVCVCVCLLYDFLKSPAATQSVCVCDLTQQRGDGWCVWVRGCVCVCECSLVQ